MLDWVYVFVCVTWCVCVSVLVCTQCFICICRNLIVKGRMILHTTTLTYSDGRGGREEEILEDDDIMLR